MSLVQKSLEVFLAEGPIVAVGEGEIATLKAAVKASPKGRARINAHPDGDDMLHEMIIAIDPSSYIRPHKHPGKSEAFHIVEGEVDIVVLTTTARSIASSLWARLAAAGHFTTACRSRSFTLSSSTATS